MATYRQTQYGWRAEVRRRGAQQSQSGFRTKAAAVAWASRIESEVMAGVRGEIPNLTVSDLLDKYLREVTPWKKGKRWEEVRIALFKRDRIAQVRLRSLGQPHASDWQQRRLKQVSGASVRRERNLLNNVFELARKEWHWLNKNPFEGVRRPKDGKSRNRIATDDEIKTLLAYSSKNLGRAIVAALETGMRASEVVAVAEIHGDVARLFDSKNGEGREIPLSGRAKEALGDGVPLSAGSISALFAELCKKTGISGLTYHDLRHTACTRLAKRLSLLELCRMMGWKDPRHALVYYNEPVSEIAKKL